MHIWKKWKKIGVILLCLFVLDCVFVSVYRNSVKKELSFYSSVTMVDVGVVLMGDFSFNKANLGKETLRRLNHTIDLYNEKEFHFILCVGGNRPKRGITGSVLMKEYLVKKGIPEDHVYMEMESYDTVSNWAKTKAIVENENWASMMIITSPLHSTRVSDVIQNSNINNVDVYFKPYDSHVVIPKISYLNSWKNVHYEWTVMLLKNILSEKDYQSLLHKIRAQ